MWKKFLVFLVQTIGPAAIEVAVEAAKRKSEKQ
jgi:hypothetical protein